MFVARVTRHTTSKHILLCQQIAVGAKRQHVHLLVKAINAGHARTARSDT